MSHGRLIGGLAALGTALALAFPGLASAHSGAAGYVYTETNASTGNAILAYARANDGTLTWLGTYPTHGLGTGAGLATQGEVILAGGGKWLLAVNAGSNDISTFRVDADGRLGLTDRAGAQGSDPVSLTAHGSYVYVLDAGGSGNIAGFWIGGGMLHRIAGSVRAIHPRSLVEPDQRRLAFRQDPAIASGCDQLRIRHVAQALQHGPLAVAGTRPEVRSGLLDETAP